MAFPIPANETGRVAALRSYGILDSSAEIAYDEVGELAAQLCQCPVAAVGFIDEDRHWLKAKYGLPPEDNQIPRELSLCAQTICGSELFLSPDLTQDRRFRDNPFVAGAPHFKFYCGMPLITPEGHALGTLCVMDFQPRELAFEQQEALRRLSHQIMVQLALRRKVIELDHTLRELDRAHAEIAAEKSRTEDLLANLLPRPIVEELMRTGRVEPRYVRAATILFADFKGSTLLAESIEPAALIGLLDEYFTAFDEIVARNGLEKIRTIGDGYMAVGGVPGENRRHPFDACLAALEMRGAASRMNSQRERLRLPTLELRIGLHTGPVIAGVIGRRKLNYDIWGDAVNVAALIEANGAPGRVNLSETVAGHVGPLVELEPRGSIAAKNKGELQMFFLKRLKPEFSRDADGCAPNERFAAELNRLLTGYSG